MNDDLLLISTVSCRALPTRASSLTPPFSNRHRASQLAPSTPMASSTANYKLFTPYKLANGLELKNRIVMAPLTRARADPVTGAPSEIHEIYYEQRASAGLIITEATSISPAAHGWYSAPQMHTEQQMEAWKKVVDRVHAKGGKIFQQLWHIGRQGLAILSPNNEVVSASAIGLPGGSLRDAQGNHHPYSVPRALETDEVAGVIEEFRKAAALAKRAGFDGIEIHSANGYLVDQFLQSVSNKRTDKYGGSVENRARFLLELLDALTLEFPSDRIAFRLSPNGAFGGMGSPDNYEQFTYVMQQLSKRNIAYVSLLDGVGFGFHDKGRLLTAFDAKTHFKGTVIVNGDYTRDLGEGVVRSGSADLVSYGRPYISNPDLVERFQNDWPLNPIAGYETWWDPTWGAKGLITFPAYEPKTVN